MIRVLKKTVIILLSFFSLHAHCQDYDTGLGIRTGVAWGLTVKHFVQTDGAVEGIISRRFNGLLATGLYEKHIPVFDTEGFYFFYGGGVHLGMWKKDIKDWFSSTDFQAGLDGIIGLEYSFGDVPLSLGMDWKPGFNLVSDPGMYIDNIAVSIRYLIR